MIFVCFSSCNCSVVTGLTSASFWPAVRYGATMISVLLANRPCEVFGLRRSEIKKY